MVVVLWLDLRFSWGEMVVVCDWLGVASAMRLR